MQPSATVTLAIDPGDLTIWTPLLGGGIGIPTPVGISLKSFLCHRLMIATDYLDQRIQTILVNSRPVDDPDSLPISDGDVIALSAAMPGLAGATLRRGGHLAPMRAAISCPRDVGSGPDQAEGMVILKLFNLVARELGPRILSGEIWLKAKDAADLQRQNVLPEDFRIPGAPDDWVRILPPPPAARR